MSDLARLDPVALGRATEANQMIDFLQGAVEALTEADTISQAMTVKAFAETAETFTRARDLGLEAEHRATAVRLAAERRLGDMLREGQKTGEVATSRDGGRPRKSITVDDAFPDQGLDGPKTLADLGITPNEASSFKRLAAVPDPVFNEVVTAAEAEGTISRADVLRRAMAVVTPVESPEDRAARETREANEFTSREFAKSLEGIWMTCGDTPRKFVAERWVPDQYRTIKTGEFLFTSEGLRRMARVLCDVADAADELREGVLQ